MKFSLDRLLMPTWGGACLLYTSDAADERSSVDLGGRRLIKKKNKYKKKKKRSEVNTIRNATNRLVVEVILEMHWSDMSL